MLENRVASAVDIKQDLLVLMFLGVAAMCPGAGPGLGQPTATSISFRPPHPHRWACPPASDQKQGQKLLRP